MDYSISVINEKGKNYFLACHKDKRFLFSRLDASSFISTPECDELNKFEVRRKDWVIMTGESYNWYHKNPVFLIRYSEIKGYDPSLNNISPCETLFADHFQPDDMIFSNVNAHEVRVMALLSVLSFMENLDDTMYSFQNESRRHNIEMVIAANQSFIARVHNNMDALGLETFIVPIGF